MNYSIIFKIQYPDNEKLSSEKQDQMSNQRKKQYHKHPQRDLNICVTDRVLITVFSLSMEIEYNFEKGMEIKHKR